MTKLLTPEEKAEMLDKIDPLIQETEKLIREAETVEEQQNLHKRLMDLIAQRKDYEPVNVEEMQIIGDLRNVS